MMTTTTTMMMMSTTTTMMMMSMLLLVAATTLAAAQNGDVKLRIRASKQNIFEGDNFTISCTNSSGYLNPNSTFSWELPPNIVIPEQQFSENKQTISIVSVSRKYNGKYKCSIIGTSFASDKTIDIYYPPQDLKIMAGHGSQQIYEKLLHVFIAEGSSLTLTCEAVSNPTLEWSWWTSDTDLNKFTNVLSLNKPQNGSNYTCKGKYEMDKQSYEMSASIIIEVPISVPTLTTNSTGDAKEGDSVAMNCSHDNGTGQWYAWTQNGQPIIEVKERYIFSKEGASLLVTDIQGRDSGEYQCTVQNHLGRKSSNVFKINVTSENRFIYIVIALVVIALSIAGGLGGVLLWRKLTHSRSII
ncbi:cell adhesion molecule CEACAM2-like isoform X2 [Petromyzon marinus]|uniref:Carcinoembryonic antigen-related cell adhesion molecule 5-like isoform X2 n=1 Tax=Petromyzon marinus TaxID=7757 RepID=A0AAJ7TMZ6_PETMA|nr:carcinoembryonic antigen-related cell adhesion molecule 5-like isoform X2 [Petromyzon marinus]